ncbi:hypothetical protein A3C31_00330 [Candidatus Roizmanbacteria bacterium RIFCSPHIGHO2_02_FULL_40_53]|nr:MAG: hypothetical protein A3C31_00330 [Candidatus Roizmanbacteria bacterium RIFCSPHIGHO2_02_FULL_40_53]
MLVGNLTRDPELKYTPSGAPVCSIGLATNRSWTTAEGQTKEEVQYHRITAWHKLAELCAKLLTKGSKVYVEGRIAYRSYTGKDGQQRSLTEIILDDFIVFGTAKKATSSTTGEETPEEVSAPAANTVESGIEEAEEEPKKSGKKKKKDESETIDPDDIPF